MYGNHHVQLGHCACFCHFKLHVSARIAANDLICNFSLVKIAFLYTITDLPRRGDIQCKTCGYGLTVKTGALLRWLERISFFFFFLSCSCPWIYFDVSVFCCTVIFVVWCTYVLIVLCLRQVVSTCRPLLPRTVSTAYCLSGPSCANVFRCIVSCLHNSAINLLFLMYRLVFRFYIVHHMLSLKGEDFKLTVNDIHILAPQYLFFSEGTAAPLAHHGMFFDFFIITHISSTPELTTLLLLLLLCDVFFVALSCRAMGL